MDTRYYLHEFEQCAELLDKKGLAEHQLDVNVGVWVDSAVLKIQKRAWLNPTADARPFRESVFFSIWVNEETIRETKIYYNIHALQLRQLKNYRIKSREFAAAFRTRFLPFAKDWPNVSVNYGPLTLMEGWKAVGDDDFEKDVVALANRFLTVQFIIDELFDERRMR